MIEVITPELYQDWQSALQEMHRQRYRVFKERMRWDVSGTNGEERDQYDELGPTYILAFNAGERLVGSWRLLPTTGPFMLRDEFAALMAGSQPPSRPGLWESSRFAVEAEGKRDASLAALSPVTSELFCGLIEHCLDSGIDEVVTVYDVRIARLLPRIGCAPKRTTGVVTIGTTRTLAGWFDISEAVLATVREAGVIEGSVIGRTSARGKSMAA